jgi:FkbM family methyltransferase
MAFTNTRIILGSNMNHPFYSRLILPYTRLELPGWGRLMALTGVYNENLWNRAPFREIRGKYHGYTMMLDTSDVADRTGYFLGRFYDLATQLFLREVIAPGDTFIDVGANIGMLTLLAARLVGLAGQVLAFEPNPSVYERLRYHVERNGIRNVLLNAVGLSDTVATLPLRVWANNKGWGTFGELSPDEQRLVTKEYECHVVNGDDVVNIAHDVPLIIKIDVEGYECHVIRGLENTIRKHQPIIITEVIESNLRRAGSTPAELFTIMTRHGYLPYALEIRRRYARHVLKMRRVAEVTSLCEPNVAWLRPDGDHLSRLSVKVDQ